MSLSVAVMLQAGENPNLEAAVVKDVGTIFEQEIPEVVHALLGLEADDRQRASDLQQVLAYLVQRAPVVLPARRHARDPARHHRARAGAPMNETARDCWPTPSARIFTDLVTKDLLESAERGAWPDELWRAAGGKRR